MRDAGRRHQRSFTLRAHSQESTPRSPARAPDPLAPGPELPALTPGTRRFTDRHDAGRRLAASLERFRAERPVVVAIPRGGVAVATEVAGSLGAPLDVAVVCKLGAPHNREFAIGALAEGGVHVLSTSALRALGISGEQRRALIAENERQLAERVRFYRGAREAVAVSRRTVILVDDGLATGRSALAAVRSLRGRGVARVLLAVPIASREAVAALGREVQELVCLEVPAELGAVGCWYEDFRPSSDAEVELALAAGSDPGPCPRGMPKDA
jgi:putative phosphoribosyl transferase